MIYDFSSIIQQYSSTFTKKSMSTFNYGGITYNDTSTTDTIQGIMTPLEDTDVEMLCKLGYSITGKRLFFISGTEDILTETDVIVDDSNIEWVILPKDDKGDGSENWLEHGNFMKYIVSRKVL